MAIAITGTVTQTTNPLEVTLDGDEEPVAVTFRDGEYTPVIDDRVWLIEVARFQWMIGGRIVNEASPDDRAEQPEA